MEKEEILKKYKRPEDRFCMATVLDKIEQTKKTGKVQTTDFLDRYQKEMIEKELRREGYSSFFFFGGIENTERGMFFFLPKKEEEKEIDKIEIAKEIMAAIRIVLPKEEYEHREYLGGILKLGIERKKIGDILCQKKEADMIIVKSVLSFLLTNLPSLTRFKNAQIKEIELEEIREKKLEFEEKKIQISSNRLDSIVAELASISRSKAVEWIEEERISINGIKERKITKGIKEKDILTIRGKGKYIIDKIEGFTRSGRMKLEVKKYK